MLPLCLLMCTTPDPSQALAAFVKAPQSAYNWAWKRPNAELSLTSQTWQGTIWKHDLLLQYSASQTGSKDTAFLVITGDRVDAVDKPFGQSLADRSGLTVATLFNVPNQPLFEKREDDLIAYSFEKFLETSDTNWPLLLPMTNSAVKAMDAVQASTHGRIKKFIVTGESKRGWTTWLVGALQDPRVIGIAPVAFDNLGFVEQFQHQMASWGHLSEMLDSYTEKGLEDQAQTEGGKAIIGMIDPISYLSDLKTPVLSIRGGNDRYWATDAMTLYWGKVHAPKGLLVLPNEGHDFQKDDDYLAALAHFAQDCREPKNLAIGARIDKRGMVCTWSSGVKQIDLWCASSPTKDFRDSKWSVIKSVPVPSREVKSGSAVLALDRPDSGFRAYFASFRRSGGTLLTSEVYIVGGP